MVFHISAPRYLSRTLEHNGESKTVYVIEFVTNEVNGTDSVGPIKNQNVTEEQWVELQIFYYLHYNDSIVTGAGPNFLMGAHQKNLCGGY